MSPAPRSGLRAELRRLWRANASAGAATALDWAVVTGLCAAGAHYLAAAAAGAVAGAVADFSLKRHWAFQRAAKGSAAGEGLRYLAVAGGSLLANLACAFLLVDRLGAPAVPGVIGASALVGLLWNYPLHRWFVFRAPGAPAAR